MQESQNDSVKKEGMRMSTRIGWTRQQLLVAFRLYCQMPFGRMHSGNPEIIKYATLIDRTPSALAMKLVNIASLDPAITANGRKGLTGASSADRAMWSEMQSYWGRFAIDSQEAIRRVEGLNATDNVVHELIIDHDLDDYTGYNRSVQSTARIGHELFREAVLSSYDNRCCMTGLSLPQLLVASHIVPWSAHSENRLNPSNGLCLSALHDRAFDRGVITVASDFTIQVSRRHAASDDKFFNSGLLAYDGKPITLPTKFAPQEEFLTYHRQNVFQS